MPMRINMMSPIPFCPSFDPWAKLTPVHVSTRMERIHKGGASLDSGAVYSLGERTITFKTRSKIAEHTKPTMGETIKELKTSVVLAQFTPSPKTWPDTTELANPTPMIDPIKV